MFRKAWLKKFWHSILFCVAVIFIADMNVNVDAAANRTVPIEFRVATPDAKTVDGARVIVVEQGGKVLASGVTDKSGIWIASIPIEQDLRFQDIREMGTVTAIAAANGYNEQVVFEVPVVQDGVQPIILNPVQPNKRNEPTVALGNLHRHDVMQFINRYAKALGLQKQSPIPGEKGYAPWNADSNRQSQPQR